MEMENQTPETNEQTTEKKTVYIPRPMWQVIGAWIGLGLFLLVVAGFYIALAKGGF